MNDFSQAFEDRTAEIEEYLDLLDAIEAQTQLGPPRLGNNGHIITVQQRKILYSSVYLLLYNLVEATVTRCLDAVCAAVAADQRLPSELSDEVRQEWVRFIARTHVDLSYPHRLEAALLLCKHLVEELPVSRLEINKGEPGNWDDDIIEKISIRLGCPLNISPSVASQIKRPDFQNSQKPLRFIRKLRNDLAHGHLSFAECGADKTVEELRDLSTRTILYLREVVDCFKSFIDSQEYLLPTQRPVGART